MSHKILIAILGSFAYPNWHFKKDDVPIFMFHRVLPGDNINKPMDANIYIEKDKFENVLNNIKKYFQISCLKTFLERKIPLEKKSCFITFDDGWIDSYTVAFPILKKYDTPATIFLPTGMIGTNLKFWFNRLEEIINSNSLDDLSGIFNNYIKILDAKNTNVANKKELYLKTCTVLKKLDLAGINRVLKNIEMDLDIDNEQAGRTLINWEEVEEMGNNNISFGSHCVNHSILPNLKREEKKFEIHQSREDLLNKNTNFVNCISFPNGNYDQETLDIATNAGYSLFLSASFNKCGEGDSPRLAHRNNIANHNSEEPSLFFSLFKAKLKKRVFKSSKFIKQHQEH